jgi:hypothetical protein
MKIHGFDKQFLGKKSDNNFKMIEFNLLIRAAIMQKKMPKRKEEDPSTWN